jgi:hypothetical protein
MKEKLLQFAKRAWVLPLIVFVLALGIRLVGVGWGLKNDLHNQSYHPDELLNWAVSQQIEPTKGHFTPSFYNYPTLYLTLLRVSSDVVGTYGGTPRSDDVDGTWSYISRCHLAGRIINCIAGALTVLFCFLSLARWTNRWGSVMGSALIAIAPAHVVHSRFQTVDILATCFLTISIYFALRMVPKDESPTDVKQLLKNALWAGVFAGLSAGTKYTGGLVILVPLVALIAYRPPQWGKALLIALGAWIFVFILSTPGVLLETSKFCSDFTYEMQHTASGHGLVFVNCASGFLTHIANLFRGIGTLMVLLSVAGFGVAFTKRSPWVLPVAAFMLTYYFVIGRSDVMFLRYTFPLYPVLAIGFGWLMGYCHENRSRLIAVVIVGIVSVLGIDPGAGIRQTLIMTAWMYGDDPRDTAVREFRKEDRSMAVVGLASDPWFYTPPFYKDTALGPANATLEKRIALMSESRNPRVVRYLPQNGEARQDWDLRLFDELKPTHIAVSSFEAGDIVRLSKVKDLAPNIRSQVDAGMAFLTRLQKEYQLEIGVGGDCPSIHDLEYIRPRIEIWKRKNH